MFRISVLISCCNNYVEMLLVNLLKLQTTIWIDLRKYLLLVGQRVKRIFVITNMAASARNGSTCSELFGATGL